MLTPRIEVASVSKRRRRSLLRQVEVLTDVSFQVGAGEVVGFLGPNGAGKTTTMRIIAGLSRPSEGTISICGEPATPDHLRSVGTLIEGPALYPWMDATQNLNVLTSSSDKAYRAELLKRLDLSTQQPVSQFSQGMRQKLAIAVAVINGDKAILLDEPTNGLDPAAVRRFQQLMANLKAEGRAILLSSHQIGDVNKMCDRVVLLNAGSIVATGTALSLRANRVWQRVRPHSKSLTDLSDALAPGFHCEIDPSENAVMIDTEDIPGLRTSLMALDGTADMFPVEVSLEDRFLALTQTGRP